MPGERIDSLSKTPAKTIAPKTNTSSYKPQESNSATMDQLRLYKAGFKSELSFYGDIFTGENILESWKKHSKRLQADYQKYIQAHPTASWFNGMRIESWIVEQMAE